VTGGGVTLKVAAEVVGASGNGYHEYRTASLMQRESIGMRLARTRSDLNIPLVPCEWNVVSYSGWTTSVALCFVVARHSLSIVRVEVVCGETQIHSLSIVRVEVVCGETQTRMCSGVWGDTNTNARWCVR
jgi:hypothetical protein